MNFKAARTHFLRDVFLAVTVVVAYKLPIVDFCQLAALTLYYLLLSAYVHKATGEFLTG